MHRLFPSLTIFCHSDSYNHRSQDDIDRWHDRDSRPHDPPIKDLYSPAIAAEALMLELSLSDKNLHSAHITIVSSPFRNCLETSALLAHRLGIFSIRVHYGVGDSMKEVRLAGFDTINAPLYLSENQMQQALDGITDLLTPLIEIDIEKISGNPPPWTEDEYTIRMLDALDEIRSEFVDQDEHIIVVTHKDVLSAAAAKFGGLSTGATIYDVKYCSFLCIASVKGDGSWMFAKSGMSILTP